MTYSVFVLMILEEFLLAMIKNCMYTYHVDIYIFSNLNDEIIVIMRYIPEIATEKLFHNM